MSEAYLDIVYLKNMSDFSLLYSQNRDMQRLKKKHHVESLVKKALNEKLTEVTIHLKRSVAPKFSDKNEFDMDVDEYRKILDKMELKYKMSSQEANTIYYTYLTIDLT